MARNRFLLGWRWNDLVYLLAVHLMNYIKDIAEANVEEGGSGAFNIYLKKFKE